MSSRLELEKLKPTLDNLLRKKQDFDNKTIQVETKQALIVPLRADIKKLEERISNKEKVKKKVQKQEELLLEISKAQNVINSLDFLFDDLQRLESKEVLEQKRLDCKSSITEIEDEINQVTIIPSS